MRRRVVIDMAISLIPAAVVVAAVVSLVYGLARFLRGDETLAAVAWAIVVPVLIVLVGLGVQMLLVALATRLYGATEYEAEDEAPFL